MYSLVFDFDPWRGGFELRFEATPPEHPGNVAGGLVSSQPYVPVQPIAAFDGLIKAYAGVRGRIFAIESFWDHGGLPLRGIQGSDAYPEGEYPMERSELRIGALTIKQGPETLELWFRRDGDLSPVVGDRQYDAATGITVWFSPDKVRAGWPVPGGGRGKECPLLTGIAIEVPRTVIAGPISLVRLMVSDFK